MAFDTSTKRRRAQTGENGIPYFKSEWVKEVAEVTNADDKMQRIGRKMDEKHAYIVLECPEGKDRLAWFDWDEGTIVDYGYEEHESPADFGDMPALDGAEYITTARYEYMVKVNTKQINAMKALTSPHFNLQGSKTRLMKRLKQLQHWQDIFTEIPVEYGV